MAVGFATLSLLDGTSTYWLMVAGLVPLGAGMGLATTPATYAIVRGLPRAKQGVGSAVNDAARELGGALGIAILGSVLNDSYRSGTASAARSLPPELAEPVQRSLGFTLHLAEGRGDSLSGLAATAQQSFVDGLSTALVVAALALSVPLPCSSAVLLREHEARDQHRPGIDACGGLCVIASVNAWRSLRNLGSELKTRI